ncbi:MAG: GNAT family N-acetyltransferase [Clostridiales bacterium]|nr:MAG: GNAT family N-acetyltransferase [Clostridiales bacterium]
MHKKTYDEQKFGLTRTTRKNHPLIVAEGNGRILGYSSLSPYRDKEAYKTTVELSVYVSPNYRKMGVATALMSEIIRYAKR